MQDLWHYKYILFRVYIRQSPAAKSIFFLKHSVEKMTNVALYYFEEKLGCSSRKVICHGKKQSSFQKCSFYRGLFDKAQFRSRVNPI